MSTSGTYNFGSPQNEQIITEAYERAGIVMDIATDQKIKSALRSINFIFISWINKRLNLFTIKLGMLALVAGKTSYILPDHAIDVLEVNLRTSVRNLGGVAASNQGGIAQNAFDGSLLTSCAQTAPDGAISYTWGGPNYSISMIGITSFVDRSYTLQAQYSYTGEDADWITCLTLTKTFYSKNELQWFVVPIPVPAPYFRVVETGGATLNIAELYFNTNINDKPISRGSRNDYMSYPNKNQPGIPSLYWVDRQINPVLNLYETPNGIYNNIFYSYKRQIQDIGRLTDTAEVPMRFQEALTSNLAFRLALKDGKMDRLPALKIEMQEAFADAAYEDGEKVNVRIQPKSAGRWSA